MVSPQVMVVVAAVASAYWAGHQIVHGVVALAHAVAHGFLKIF